MEQTATKFIAWYCGNEIDTFSDLKQAKICITEHPNYKKSYFTKKGEASSKNPNQDESFRIYDNMGYGWYIR